MNSLKRIQYLLFIGILLCIVACQNNTPQEEQTGTTEKLVPGKKRNTDMILRHPIRNDGTIDSSQLAILDFEEETYDFGTIKQGEVVKHEYKFINTGKAPLLISYVRSTCGCTVADWPEEMLNPGESGVIKVKFDSENRIGEQSKPITIISNAIPSERVIHLKGIVEK